jgi:hypothetical protein
MRELNRLGVTGVIDAGGGFQNYPEDYEIIQKLHADGELTLRIAYNLFTQKKGEEVADFTRWAQMVKPGQGDDTLRHNGAGEMLVFSAADFEDFREPRPELGPEMGTELADVVRVLVRNRWPWRLHATYDETITRALDAFEQVNREMPIGGLHWFLDHCETISDRNIDRVAALGGGIAVQHRMMFQGEDFAARYGHEALARTPPIRRMLEAGVPVGAGTDATRVASYNPWVSIAWLVTGQDDGRPADVPGSQPPLPGGGAAALDGEQHLVLHRGRQEGPDQGRPARRSSRTRPGRHGRPGRRDSGHRERADPSGRQGRLRSRATMRRSPGPAAATPDWSPVRTFGGYQRRAEAAGAA